VTPAERDFHAADVRVISLYIQQAQPAVEAYCTALATRDEMAAEQLRADTRALAAEMRANAAARLAKLDTAAQIVAAARQALDVAGVVLDRVAPPASQPAAAGRDGTQ
jgi:hypothetical protein